MKSSEGKLLTSGNDIKYEAVKHYRNVSRHQQINPDLKNLQENMKNSVKKDRKRLEEKISCMET